MKENENIHRRDFLKTLGLTAATLPFAGAAFAIGKAPASTPEIVGKDFSAAYGIVPPMLTPFKADKTVDFRGLETLIDWHYERGVSGLFIVCGSGEMRNLSPDEAVAMAEVAVKRAEGKLNILVGSTLNFNYDAVVEDIETTRRLTDVGVDGCFVVTPRPYPNDGRPVDEVMVDYFTRIHEATTCGLFVYELPGGRASHLSPKAMTQIGKLPRMIAVKDTSAHNDQPAPEGLAPVKAKLDSVGDTIKLMQANVRHFLNSLKMGCTGGINTSANVAPGLFSALYKMHEAGDYDTAERLHGRIIEIDETIMHGYVQSAKVAVALMGVDIEPLTRGRRGQSVSQRVTETARATVALIERTEKEFGITYPM